MTKKLYNLMDWAGIEAIVYAEETNPEKLLGPHKVPGGILMQAFFPETKKVVLLNTQTGKQHKMEQVDEAGFYAVLVPEKKIFPYVLQVTDIDGNYTEQADCYAYGNCIEANALKRFVSGINYNIYDRLGAHPVRISGVGAAAEVFWDETDKVKESDVTGVHFAVWAPNAMDVMVVGDFNEWDGRAHQMCREETGVFTLFIPDIKPGEIYKYHVKSNATTSVYKADPYGFASEVRPANASVITNIANYKWKDKQWMKLRKTVNWNTLPMAVYELHLGSWKKPEDGEREFYNYRELAPMVAEYVKEMGYTHIELMPVMEHPLDESWGYQVTGYYAVTSRYGSPQDFMYFVDYMHAEEIGVIVDWVPAHFPKDAHGLGRFDGTCLYEHADPRQGEHPDWGTYIYNYGRKEVANFLIANAMFWVDKYHVDGIRMDAVSSMLYLDYARRDGEWIPNMYGGKENLEAMDMLKHLCSIVKKQGDGAILIAEESTAWPMVTSDVEEGGLGFDFKWNMGWMNDFTEYIRTDPLFRKGRHGTLTFSMIYAYSERFILIFSHDEVVYGKGSMIMKMPGDKVQKFANLRVSYGYMTTHPGKKLLFMGQEFAQREEWNEKKALQWELLKEQEHKQMQRYVKELNMFYRNHPALYAMDSDPEGFQWLSCLDADHSIVTFMRKDGESGEQLLVLCNFTPVVYENFKLGVPFKGKFKEIFNSDARKYGGDGNENTRLRQSSEIECDGFDQSINVVVPPLGIAIFSCTKTESTSKKNTAKGRRQV